MENAAVQTKISIISTKYRLAFYYAIRVYKFRQPTCMFLATSFFGEVCLFDACFAIDCALVHIGLPFDFEFSVTTVMAKLLVRHVHHWYPNQF